MRTDTARRWWTDTTNEQSPDDPIATTIGGGRRTSVQRRRGHGGQRIWVLIATDKDLREHTNTTEGQWVAAHAASMAATRLPHTRLRRRLVTVMLVLSLGGLVMTTSDAGTPATIGGVVAGGP
ncbi:hypothetical protein, partial [Gordonia alkanivorans]|uniref:hypothetical protein n=1 Tax=Gordonia alkanivorans TaxID=84096 RepID=UPI0018CC26E8